MAGELLKAILAYQDALSHNIELLTKWVRKKPQGAFLEKQLQLFIDFNEGRNQLNNCYNQVSMLETDILSRAELICRREIIDRINQYFLQKEEKTPDEIEKQIQGVKKELHELVRSKDETKYLPELAACKMKIIEVLNIRNEIATLNKRLKSGDEDIELIKSKINTLKKQMEDCERDLVQKKSQSVSVHDIVKKQLKREIASPNQQQKRLIDTIDSIGSKKIPLENEKIKLTKQLATKIRAIEEPLKEVTILEREKQSLLSKQKKISKEKMQESKVHILADVEHRFLRS